MAYDTVRGYPPHALSFPNYYYGDRNMTITLPQAGRIDPRGYPMNSSTSSHRGRESVAREEPHVEPGPSRRRISVACARCRKRKIRCSGDPGNGTGCTNCKGAGIDPSHCQFHRVGSDNVHKVMDNFHMTNNLNGPRTPNSMGPVYPSSTNSPLHTRAINSQTYPHMDPKSIYPTPWTLPYSDDTSPIDGYNLDPPTSYVPNSTSISNTNLYSRWTQPVTKGLHPSFLDQDPTYTAHGMPCIQTSLRPNNMTGSLSPLNMTSLQLVLPERPRTRQIYIADSTAPQRQLPMPQPSPAQCSRNVVDQLQDQRLRSTRTLSNIVGTSASTFAKTSPPWTVEHDNVASFTEVMTTNGSNGQATHSASISSAPDGEMTIFPVTTDGSITSNTASQMHLNFSAAALLDPIDVAASNKTYSNFRESRTPCSSSSQIARENSQTNLYNFNLDRASKGNSVETDVENDCSLVSGQQYVPLSHAQTQKATNDKRRRKSLEKPEKPLHQESIPSLTSGF